MTDVDRLVLRAVISLYPLAYAFSIREFARRVGERQPSLVRIYAAVERLEASGFVIVAEGPLAPYGHRRQYVLPTPAGHDAYFGAK